MVKVYKVKKCIICEKEFEPLNSNKLACSPECKSLQRKAVRNLWYKNNAKRIYDKYKSYHIKYNAGRLRAERKVRKMKIPRKCQICNSEYKIEIHHIDKNVNNNDLSNLALLCKNCHFKADIKALASTVSLADLEKIY